MTTFTTLWCTRYTRPEWWGRSTYGLSLGNLTTYPETNCIQGLNPPFSFFFFLFLISAFVPRVRLSPRSKRGKGGTESVEVWSTTRVAEELWFFHNYSDEWPPFAGLFRNRPLGSVTYIPDLPARYSDSLFLLSNFLHFRVRRFNPLLLRVVGNCAIRVSFICKKKNEIFKHPSRGKKRGLYGRLRNRQLGRWSS